MCTGYNTYICTYTHISNIYTYLYIHYIIDTGSNDINMLWMGSYNEFSCDMNLNCSSLSCYLRKPGLSTCSSLEERD
jgi:hypothetical protein